MPCRIDENNYPFELYRCMNDVLVLIRTFQVCLADYINRA